MNNKLNHFIIRIKSWLYYRFHSKPGFNQLIYKGIPIRINPNIKPGVIYFINDNDGWSFKKPNKKDGTPDMRYLVNKIAWYKQ